MWACEQGTTDDLSVFASACLAVIVLQSPTVGAPKSGPSVTTAAWPGAVVTVRAVVAATATRVRVIPESVMGSSSATDEL